MSDLRLRMRSFQNQIVLTTIEEYIKRKLRGQRYEVTFKIVFPVSKNDELSKGTVIIKLLLPNTVAEDPKLNKNAKFNTDLDIILGHVTIKASSHSPVQIQVCRV